MSMWDIESMVVESMHVFVSHTGCDVVIAVIVVVVVEKRAFWMTSACGFIIYIIFFFPSFSCHENCRMYAALAWNYWNTQCRVKMAEKRKNVKSNQFEEKCANCRSVNLMSRPFRLYWSSFVYFTFNSQNIYFYAIKTNRMEHKYLPIHNRRCDNIFIEEFDYCFFRADTMAF